MRTMRTLQWALQGWGKGDAVEGHQMTDGDVRHEGVVPGLGFRVGHARLSNNDTQSATQQMNCPTQGIHQGVADLYLGCL
jgi:hypothetical protein